MNKQWRYFLLLFSILAIGIAILLWSAWQKVPQKPEMPAQIVRETKYYEIESRPTESFGQARKSLPERSSFRFFDTFAPIVKPFEKLISSTEHIGVSLRSRKAGEAIPSPQDGLPRSAAGPLAPYKSLMDSTGLAMTKINEPLPASDPIFKKLYPDYYLDALSVLHRVIVNDGFMPDTVFTIPDEDALFAFLSTTIDYARAKNFIAQTDAERFRKALHGETRELLRKERYSFLDKIFDYFHLPNAFADVVTSPDCYADPLPFNPIPGVNLPFDYCCNCGLICPDVGPPVFVPDCSIKDCDIPLGCLNLVCPGGNAIWDPLTGICGCDNPISSAENIPSILKNALNCIAPKVPTPPTPPPPPPPPSTP